MEELQAGENITYAIGANGHARWFTVGQQSVGKTLTLTLLEGARSPSTMRPPASTTPRSRAISQFSFLPIGRSSS